MKLPRFLRAKTNPVNKTVIALYGSGTLLATPKDYRSLAIAGYQSCATAYSCVKLIANTASRIGWYVQNVDAKGNAKEVEGHPVVTLLNRPNEVESGARFTEKVISYLLLAGNSYVLRVKGAPGGPPRFMYALRPDRMEINADKTGKYLIESYTYARGNGGPTFPADEVMHLMEFHPTDDFYGLSRIEVAARQIDTMNAAAEWNAKLLQNDLKAPGIITSKSTFDLELFKKQFKESYQGSEKAGTPIMLEGEDIKWETLSINPKDADWLKGQQFTLRQVCSIFGIDPCLVGDSEYATYSNKQEARKGLYLEVILPLMDLLRDEYQHWLFPEGSREQLMYDKDSIEELQEDRGKKYAYLESSSFLTLNEKRVEAGFDEIVGGDVILVPISNVPLEEAVAPPEPMPDFTPADEADTPDDETGDEPPPAKSRPAARRAIKAVKKSFWTDPERKDSIWKNFDRRLAAQERAFIPLVKKYLQGQADMVKAKLDAGAAQHMLFDIKAETKAYAERFFPHYEQAFRYAGRSGYAATQGKLWTPAEEGKAEANGFTVDPEMLKKLREQIDKSAKFFNETTWGFIEAELKNGVEANLTTEALAQEIWKSLGERAAWEARRIASTEMTRTDGYGNHEGYKQNESIDRQVWNCQKLATSRGDHIEADGQEVGIDEDFDIGGEPMAWPGDQRASAGNVCNCRCSTIPIVGEL